MYATHPGYSAGERAGCIGFLSGFSGLSGSEKHGRGFDRMSMMPFLILKQIRQVTEKLHPGQSLGQANCFKAPVMLRAPWCYSVDI